MFSTRHRTIYKKKVADEILAFSSFQGYSHLKGAPNVGLGLGNRRDEITRFVDGEGSNFPSNSVPLPFVSVVLDGIERDVVKSSDQQQWQLRQAHADHEQHRAEEQDQRGPDHHEPERGGANQRENHHDEGVFSR